MLHTFTYNDEMAICWFAVIYLHFNAIIDIVKKFRSTVNTTQNPSKHATSKGKF